jgi:hypothetical protein
MSGQHSGCSLVPRALSLRKARKLWRECGGEAADIPRTGEERYSHPALERPITVNKRKKQAPRKLTSALRRILNTLKSRRDG